METIIFYHGTSDILPIENEIIPPCFTNIKREEWRKKLNAKVFITNSLMSAEMYAKKSCKKYGGSPIVYKVKPVGDVWNVNNTEYVVDKAIIIKE